MAEWFKRGTVNTFYRGSNPLKTLNKNKIKFYFKFKTFSTSYFFVFLFIFIIFIFISEYYCKL